MIPRYAEKATENTAASRSKSNFFGEPPGSTPFFGPGIQKQAATAPAKEVSPDEIFKEVMETVKEADNIQQQVHQGTCELFGASLAALTKTGNTIDKNTAKILDLFAGFAANCSSLAPYIISKPTAISDNHYKTYSHYRGNDNTTEQAKGRFLNDAWHGAVGDYLKTTDREKIRKVGGFYNRPVDVVTLPTDSSFGNALHESVHRLSGQIFITFFGSYLNEGLTQFFTNLLLKEAGFEKETKSDYGPNLADIQLLAGKLKNPRDLMARVYFKGDTAAIIEIYTALHLMKAGGGLPRPNPDAVLKAIKPSP
ncbi:MAG: hypothetical protein ABJC98_13845 [Bacteroidota bacterium]